MLDSIHQKQLFNRILIVLSVTLARFFEPARGARRYAEFNVTKAQETKSNRYAKFCSV